MAHILVGSTVDHELVGSGVGGSESLFVVHICTGLQHVLRLVHVVSTGTPPLEFFVQDGHHHTIIQKVFSADFIGNLLPFILFGSFPTGDFCFHFGDLCLESGDEGGLGGVFSLESFQLALESGHFGLQSGYFSSQGGQGGCVVRTVVSLQSSHLRHILPFAVLLLKAVFFVLSTDASDKYNQQ